MIVFNEAKALFSNKNSRFCKCLLRAIPSGRKDLFFNSVAVNLKQPLTEDTVSLMHVCSLW